MPSGERFAALDSWIVIELNPERDLLESMAAKLCSESRLANIFRAAKINLSFFGFGFEITGAAPVTDIETALSKMLKALKKHGKKVLVSIDVASNTPYLRAFASAFQILIRQDLPLFLLMTGLYENINSLQDQKNLTFLYRAPRIALKPLNIGTIADNYRKALKLDEKLALYLARQTKGYSFAFQVLGYLIWKHGEFNDTVFSEYRQYLEDYSYEKIWSELSSNDRRICYGIATSETGKVSEIRGLLNIETNQFNPYRKRLIKKGLINGEEHGYVTFTLPLFEKFVIANYSL